MQVSELTESQIVRLTNLLSNTKTIDKGDAEKIIALSILLEISVKEAFDLEFSSYDDCIIEYSSEEYLVCTDSEADDKLDDKLDDSLDSYIDDCILPQLPKHLQYYFDNEAWKRDEKYNGRGHYLSSYDGKEEEVYVNRADYYIYRNN